MQKPILVKMLRISDSGMISPSRTFILSPLRLGKHHGKGGRKNIKSQRMGKKKFLCLDMTLSFH